MKGIIRWTKKNTKGQIEKDLERNKKRIRGEIKKWSLTMGQIGVDKKNNNNKKKSPGL